MSEIDHETATRPWGRLIQALELACQGPADLVPFHAGQALAESLSGEAPLPLEDWPASPAGYQRYLLHADPAGRFSLMALVWSAGQRTPVHGHYTWCAYHVVAGVLREQRFARVPGEQGKVTLCDEVLCPAGSAGQGHAGLELAHRLCHESGEPAVSIHVYGIDAGRISTHVNRLAAVA